LRRGADRRVVHDRANARIVESVPIAQEIRVARDVASHRKRDADRYAAGAAEVEAVACALADDVADAVSNDVVN